MPASRCLSGQARYAMLRPLRVLSATGAAPIMLTWTELRPEWLERAAHMDFTGRVVVEQRLHRARRVAQPVGALHVAQRDRLAYLVSQPAGELAAVLVCLPEEPREVLCSGASFPCAWGASDSRRVINSHKSA